MLPPVPLACTIYEPPLAYPLTLEYEISAKLEEAAKLLVNVQGGVADVTTTESVVAVYMQPSFVITSTVYLPALTADTLVTCAFSPWEKNLSGPRQLYICTLLMPVTDKLRVPPATTCASAVAVGTNVSSQCSKSFELQACIQLIAIANAGINILIDRMVGWFVLLFDGSLDECLIYS
jgi:hypothetical protein